MWLPNWPLQRRCVEKPELAQRAVVVRSAPSHRGYRVVACSEHAERLGIRPPMPFAEALALVGRAQARRLLVVDDDTWGDREALEALAQWCQRFSPLVSIEEADRPAALFLDMTGCPMLQLGEETLCERIHGELSGLGFAPRMALAETPGAAWALARFAARDRPLALEPSRVHEALSSLPIEALRLPDAARLLLRELGVWRVNQLERLPMAEVAARVGRAVVERLRQATGAAPELTIPHRPIPLYQIDEEFEEPIDQLEAVLFVLEQTAARLASILPPRRGLQQLLCQLVPESAPALEFTIDLARPSATPARWLALLQLRLETVTLRAPIERLSLRALAIGPLEARQSLLFEDDDARHSAQWTDLIERLGSRLGRDAVAAPRLVRDAQPEYAFTYASLLNSGPLKRAARADNRAPRPGARPATLLARPIPVWVTSVQPDGSPVRFEIAAEVSKARPKGHADAEVHGVTRAWGPERIETAWWRGELVARDYFRVETTTGQRFWLFRDGHRRWFLHGCFD